MNENDTSALVQRYLAVWNETDAEARSARIAELWADGGASFTRNVTAVGHDAIVSRVASAHAQFVASGQYIFRASAPAHAHHATVVVQWQMETPAGDVGGGGLSVLALDHAQRIVTDHQFPRPVR